MSPLSPGAAVRAFAESITVVRLLSGGGSPVTFDGEFFQLKDVDPGTPRTGAASASASRGRSSTRR